MGEVVKVVLVGSCAKQIGEAISISTGSGLCVSLPLVADIQLESGEGVFQSVCVKLFAPGKQIKPFWYPTVSCFILCFDWNDATSLNELDSKWIPLIDANASHTPFYIGCWDSEGVCVSHSAANKVSIVNNRLDHVDIDDWNSWQLCMALQYSILDHQVRISCTT